MGCHNLLEVASDFWVTGQGWRQYIRHDETQGYQMTGQFQILKLKRTRGRIVVDISGLDDGFEISEETVYRHRLVERTARQEF